MKTIKINAAHRWPSYVDIPKRIGAKRLLLRNGRPCCTLAYLRFTLNRNHTNYANPLFESDWGKLYLEVCKALNVKGNYNSVAEANDCIKENDVRVLAYLLTWGKLGYTEGMPSYVLTILEDKKLKSIGVVYA